MGFRCVPDITDYFAKEVVNNYVLKNVGCYGLGRVYTFATKLGEDTPFAVFESRALRIEGNEEDGDGPHIRWESAIEREGIFLEPSGEPVKKVVREGVYWNDILAEDETFSIAGTDGVAVQYPIHHREFIDIMIGAMSTFGLVEGLVPDDLPPETV